MPTFHYQALDRENRLIVGQLQADTVTQAVGELEAQGLNIQSIGTTPLASPAPATTSQTNPAPGQSIEYPRDQDALRKQLVTLMERGQPLIAALRAYSAELLHRRQRSELEHLATTIEQRDVDRAMQCFSASPNEWLALLGAVSTATDPVDMLCRFVNRSRQGTLLELQWRRVLAYPAIVACLAMAVLTLISVLTTPAFRNVYDSFDIAIDGSTSLTLAISAWIVSGRFLVVVAVLLALWLLIRLLTRRLPNSLLVAIRRRIPWRAARSARLGKLATCLADLLDAGNAPADALHMAGLLVDRRYFQPAATQLAYELNCSAEPNVRQQLSATIVHALQADLPPASRVRLLREIAIARLDDARGPVSFLLSVVGSATLIFVGILVGWMLISLFIPLIRLVDSLA